ncbi:MAG: sulfatase [Proteobacteria bacterium]|nr:sulfatase [Pseudomonadota bacterium]
MVQTPVRAPKTTNPGAVLNQQLEKVRKKFARIATGDEAENLDFGKPWRALSKRSRTTAPASEQSLKQDSDAVNIVLVVVDTERADMTSPYGEALQTTPFKSELAKDGITFTNAFSPASWTVPAMVSMFTGLYPREHGIVDGTVSNFNKRVISGQQVVPEEAVTLPERLKDLGYTTFGVNTNYHLNPKFGFSQGFDYFLGDGFHLLPFPILAVNSLAKKVHSAPKYFIWLHYFDPHFPYKPHPPWFGEWNDSKFNSYEDLTAEIMVQYYRKKEKLPSNAPLDIGHVEALHTMSKQMASTLTFLSYGLYYLGVEQNHDYVRFLRTAYKSELRATDEAIKDAFSTLDVDEQSIVIITSDHGEEIFDRRWCGHRHSVYQELIRIPLIIRLPKNKHAGKVIDTPVSLLDIVPTVLDLIGEPIPEGLSGVSLVPLIERGELSSRELIAETTYIENEIRALLDFPWKYIYNFSQKRGSLFNLSSDPGERNDLTEVDPKRAAQMHRRLFEWTKRTEPRWTVRETTPLNPKELKQLRAMGYVN